MEKSEFLKNIFLSLIHIQMCRRDRAISYTTGVPAMIGAMMVVTGAWKKDGVFNVEEFDPDPFMDALNKWGLPWQVCEDPPVSYTHLDVYKRQTLC